MNNDVMRAAMDVFALLLIGYLVFRVLRFINRTHARVGILYLAYGLMCTFFSAAYWLIHVLLDTEDYRFPFSANDVGDIGMFLLFASALAIIYKDVRKKAVLEVIGAAIFAVISVILWIVWSGEVVKDIISGIPYAYFCCHAVRSVRLSRGFRRAEWLFFAAFALGITVVEGWISFLPEPLNIIVDSACYVIMYTMLVALMCNAFVKIVRSKTTDDAAAAVSMSAVCFAWGLSSMYMSAEPMYFFPQFCSWVSLIFFTESYITYTTLSTPAISPVKKEAAL